MKIRYRGVYGPETTTDGHVMYSWITPIVMVAIGWTKNNSHHARWGDRHTRVSRVTRAPYRTGILTCSEVVPRGYSRFPLNG